MLHQIQGLHHVTSMASGARQNNAFFTETLGLRRVKKTVNFDAPDVYHLYYGDAAGTPGSVMTYFPFPGIAPRRPGVGEVGETQFAVPRESLGWWRDRLTDRGVKALSSDSRFGEARLTFTGPDGEDLALIETDDDRMPFTGGGAPEDVAIRGFRGVSLRLADAGPSADLLGFMGYVETGADGDVTRYIRENGNGADVVDLEVSAAGPASQGAGTVHHVAFAVEDRAAQLEVRKALTEAGMRVTPVIDRDYFWAIYFRTPGGVLFEIATNEPGFDADEDAAHLGEALKLPKQHAHLREKLELELEPIT